MTAFFIEKLTNKRPSSADEADVNLRSFKCGPDDDEDCGPEQCVPSMYECGPDYNDPDPEDGNKTSKLVPGVR